MKTTLDLAKRETQAWLASFHLWCREHPCPLFQAEWNRARFVLFEHLQESGVIPEPFQYLEFGVYQGDSLRWWLNQFPHPETRFVGFDSFRGFPREWIPKDAKRHFDLQGIPPRIDDPRCSLRIGWFQETLPEFRKEKWPDLPCVVNLDADLYLSTLCVLEGLAPVLREGDILIFDEFDIVTHEYRAFREFAAAVALSYRVLAAVNDYRKVAIRILRAPALPPP